MAHIFFKVGRQWIEPTPEGEFRVKPDGRGGLRRIGRLRTWRELARS